jgi:7-carboxy-7-deazaguanine synthase
METMMKDIRYPIAEHFYSLQGEGVWTGTPMVFVRLAGCNVGQYLGDSIPTGMGGIGMDFHLYENKKHSMCTAHDGTRFLCDTDYHRAEWADLAGIRALCLEPNLGHVCLTGGEPFMHDLTPLLDALAEWHVHIETSGTKPILLPNARLVRTWVTCCPKEGFLTENLNKPDEWKFLVGPGFNARHIKEFFEGHVPDVPIYLQPINGIDLVDEDAVARAVELVKANPQYRLSAQLHKYLGAR